MKITIARRWVIPGVNLLVVAATLGFGWRVSLKNTQLRAENLEIRRAIRMPYIIRGFEMGLVQYLKPVDGGSAPLASGGTRMILFGRDTCPVCETQIPWWKRLADKAVTSGAVSEVWIVSLDDGLKLKDLAEQIRVAGIPVRRYTVSTIGGFTVATGVSGVPTTVVTRDGRVIAAHAGAFTEEVLSEMVGVISSPTTTAHFPRRGIRELVLVRKQ